MNRFRIIKHVRITFWGTCYAGLREPTKLGVLLVLLDRIGSDEQLYDWVSVLRSP